MSGFEDRIEIDGTPDEVFAVLNTPRLMPRYSPMLRAESLPKGQVKKGDAFSNHFGPQGRGVRLDWRVQESESPNLIVGQVVDRTLAERFGKVEHRQAMHNLKDLIEGIHESLSISIAA